MTFTRLVLLAVAIVVALVAAVSTWAMEMSRRRLAELETQRFLLATRSGQLEFSRWGTGNPVLAIHGAGGGFDQGRLLAEALGPSDADFISLSRFGYLGSDMPSDASTKAQADAIVDLLDALGIERVSILAMSGGVPPALKFAELHPNRTHRLALLSSAPFTPFSPHVEDRPIPTGLYSALLANDAIYWCLTKLARSQLMAAFDARADLLDAASVNEKMFVERLVDTFLPASRRVKWLSNEGAAVDPRASYSLELIQAETLVVHAHDDSLNPFSIGADIAARVPKARFVPLEKGGHLLLGHHEMLQEQIERFLGG